MIEENECSLMDLSNELLIKIFQYLNPADRQILGLTCLRLREVAYLFIDDIKLHINAKYLESYNQTTLNDFLLSTRQYRNILVSGLLLTDDILPYFRQYGAGIEKICFCNVGLEGNLYKILEMMPNLSVLEIHSCDKIDVGPDGQQRERGPTLDLQNVRKLVIQFNDNLTEDDFFYLVLNAPELEHFEFLQMHFNFDQNIVTEYLMGRAGRFKTLKFPEHYFEDHELEGLLTNEEFDLESFYFKELQNLSILEFLRRQKNLKELDLTEYTKVDLQLMQCICTELHQLRSIKLYNSGVTDEALTVFLRAMLDGTLAHLEALNLNYCRKISASVFLGTLTGQAYEPLKELRIENLDIDDATMALLTLTFPNLETLSLAYNSNLTDVSIEAICGNLRHLKYFKIAKCAQIQGGVPNIGCLKRLRVLQLNEVSGVSDEQLEKFEFLDLKELHFGRSEFTNGGVEALTRSCPSMEVFGISMNSQITDQAVEWIAKRWRRLTKLELKCCSKLSDDIEMIINENCKSLKILNVYGTAGKKRQLTYNSFPNCKYLRIIEQ